MLQETSTKAQTLFQHVRKLQTCNGPFALHLSKTVDCEMEKISKSIDEKIIVEPPKVKPTRKTNWLDVLQMNPKMYWPRRYRYTMEPPPGTKLILSVKDRDQYEDNGFILLGGLFTKKFLKSLANCDQQESIELLGKHTQFSKCVICFCGQHSSFIGVRHIRQVSSNEDFGHDLFYLKKRPTDRIIGCYINLSSPIQISLKSSSHQSGELTTFTIDNSGNLVKYNFQPIFNDQTQQTKTVITLNTGDALFYHSLLSHLIVDEKHDISLLNVHLASDSCHDIEYLSQVKRSNHSKWSIEQKMKSNL